MPDDMLDLTPAHALIFRITHIENVPWALRNGLHCQSSEVRDPHFRPIGLPDLIERRKRRKILGRPGGMLSDYVPFYFTPLSPMLYKVLTGNGVPQVPKSQIAILVASLRDVAAAGLPFFFTDRHAYLQAATPLTDLANLDRIDWALLRAHDFRRDPDDPEKVERYQAEALVYRHLPVSLLRGIIGCGPAEASRLKTWVDEAGLTIRTVARPEYFF